jgi:exonuclease III
MKLLSVNLGLRFPSWLLAYPDFKARQKLLKAKILKYCPEIICFQEVTDIFLLARIIKLVRNYSFVYQGHIRVRGGVVTFFKKSKWCLKQKKFTAFTKQGKFFSKQLADRILKKGILACVLENIETRENILVINVHLTANYGQKLKDEERKILKIQLGELKNIIDSYREKGIKQIIAGDFNANYQSKVIQSWVKEINFIPVFTKNLCTVCPTKNPLCYRDQNQDYQIDNVLTHDFKKAKGRLIFNQPNQFISDHYGQLVNLG